MFLCVLYTPYGRQRANSNTTQAVHVIGGFSRVLSPRALYRAGLAGLFFLRSHVAYGLLSHHHVSEMVQFITTT